MTLNNPIYLHLLHTQYTKYSCACAYVCMRMYIYIYLYRKNVFGRPNIFADQNALSVHTVEHERY